MPHFAKLDENDIVLEVQVFSQLDVDANGGDYSTGAEAWVKSWSGHNNWKQCSYNAKQRNIYPSIGDSWDSANNKFKPKKPAASCTFNSSSYEWEWPVARPTSEWFMDGSTKVTNMVPMNGMMVIKSGLNMVEQKLLMVLLILETLNGMEVLG